MMMVTPPLLFIFQLNINKDSDDPPANSPILEARMPKQKLEANDQPPINRSESDPWINL